MMLRSVILAAAVVAASAFAPLLGTAQIDDQYIVVFHNNASAADRAAHTSVVEARGGKIMFKYEITPSFFGYSVQEAGASLLQFIRTADHLVAYVEHDGIVRLSATCKDQKDATWGLDRISETKLQLLGDYYYPPTSGEGIDVYVVDTGIRITHEEFQTNGESRADWGGNYAGDGKNEDCNGHGTHVAGTVAGNTYGVAKAANVTALKVLNCQGSGSNSGVMAGVNAVATFVSSRRRRGVANLSLGGGKSTALNAAVASVVSQGIPFVVAAGNENQDACNVSPASESSAITVGSTDTGSKSGNQVDIRSSFSNYGSCVDIFAPGSSITAAWYTSDKAYNTISGTSMASPHVAGASALYMAENPVASPSDIKSNLVSESNEGMIEMNCASSTSTCNNSPNSLLYSKFMCS